MFYLWEQHMFSEGDSHEITDFTSYPLPQQQPSFIDLPFPVTCTELPAQEGEALLMDKDQSYLLRRGVRASVHRASGQLNSPGPIDLSTVHIHHYTSSHCLYTGDICYCKPKRQQIHCARNCHSINVNTWSEVKIPFVWSSATLLEFK